MSNTATQSMIMLTLETAESQLDAGWIEIDLDDYQPDQIEARLAMVNGLLKRAEYALGKMIKQDQDNAVSE